MKNESFLQHFCNITRFLLIIKKENEQKNRSIYQKDTAVLLFD